MLSQHQFVGFFFLFGMSSRVMEPQRFLGTSPVSLFGWRDALFPLIPIETLAGEDNLAQSQSEW